MASTLDRNGSSFLLNHLGTKRKAGQSVEEPAKRLKSDIQISQLEDDDSSESEYQDGLDSDEESMSTPTLLTPITPRSPRHKYPSEFKTHVCQWPGCTKAFNRPARLAEHVRCHTGERPFRCTFPNCTKDFPRKSRLDHHFKSAHTDERSHACTWEGCGKKFLTSTRLKRHEAAHEKRDLYRCKDYPPCNESFRKHATLQRHIISVHMHKKPFPCTEIDATTGIQCTHGFDTAGKLRSHVGRMHGGAKFSCSECMQPTAFSTYSDLQTHIHLVHPPTCSYCQLACSTSRELRRHIDIEHVNPSGETANFRAYNCPEINCNRAFSKEGNLNVHIRTVHLKQRPFICGVTDLSGSKRVVDWNGEGACARSFPSKQGLEDHVRSVHQKLPRYRALQKQLHKQPEEEIQSHRRQDNVSTIARLTGVGYVEESGRQIPCTIPFCEFLFHRMYDLEGHLRSWHGITAIGRKDANEDTAKETETNEVGFETEMSIFERDAESLGIYGLLQDQTDSFDAGIDKLFASENQIVSNSNPGAGENIDESFIDPVLRYLQPDINQA